MTIAIESGVPIPDQMRTERNGKKYRFSEMSVGDSFRIPEGVKHPKQIAVAGNRRHKPWLFRVAKDDKGVLRCWRTA